MSFRFLHPERADEHGNNASCVLRIETGGRSILLTGDIERRVERRLAAQLGTGLQSDILIAGHHGSNSSTSAEFLQTVSPEWVLFSSGYANHFGFPATSVRERIAERGIQMLDTGILGAIQLRLDAEGRLDAPWGWRDKAGRLWIHRPEGWRH